MLWITTAILGGGAALITGIGGVFLGALFLLLATALLVRGDRLIALSGLLTGFGGAWLVLLAGQSVAGGALDNAGTWTAVGAVPLMFGTAFLFVGASPWYRRERVATTRKTT